MRHLLSVALAAIFMTFITPDAAGDTPIFGESELEVEHMVQFIRRKNPEFPREIAEAFFSIGQRYGIRGDIALCQSIIETGWFKFVGGTAVTLDQNNFCGLGVTSLGVRGLEFATVEDGVTAQMQHLFAYACTRPLPDSEMLLDPRFQLVSRGCAASWEELSGRWAANTNYGRDILRLFNDARSFTPDQSDDQTPSTPDYFD